MDVMNNTSKSLELYNHLYTKEIEEHTEVREIEFNVLNEKNEITTKTLPTEIFCHLFKSFFSPDMLNFGQTNRVAFLYLNNFNSYFWDKYSKGIVKLNLNPAKSVFSCMINGQETELWSLVNNWISKIEPFKTYIFQASFISPPDEMGQRELLSSAFEIIVGKNSNDPIYSKWIFPNEFMPKFCQLPQLFDNGPQIPRNITYFNIENMPSFAQADCYHENATVEAELLMCLIQTKFPKVKFRDRDYYEGVSGAFTTYANARRMEYQHKIPCLQNPALYDSVIKDTIAPIYVSTLPEEERPAFNTYMQNKAAFKRKNELLELMKIEGKPPEVEVLEFLVDERIKTISAPDYGRPPVIEQPKVVVPKPAAASWTKCETATVVVLVACIATLLFSSFTSKV